MTWSNEKVLAQLFMLRMRAAGSNPKYVALLSTIIDRIEAEGV